MLLCAYGILQARILEWVANPFSRGSSQPGIKPRSPALQADCVPSEPPRKLLVSPWEPPKWSVTEPKIRELLFRISWWKNFIKPFGLKIAYSLSNRLMRNVITAHAGASPECRSLEQCQHAIKKKIIVGA